MIVVSLSKFSKYYNVGHGVFDINLNINKGEVYGILGSNGSGKSTILRHLMGFSKPSSGSCKINGMETFDQYYKILNNVGYVPGEARFPKDIKVREYLDMFIKLRNIKDLDRVRTLVKRFKLNYDMVLSDMSFGQKRRMTIVIAFMHDPDILILDEAVSGLDPIMQLEFVKLLKEEKRAGKTILLSSHTFREISAVCDRVAIIKNGKIVDELVLDDLEHNKDKTFELSFDELVVMNNFIKRCSTLGFIKVISYDYNTLKCRIGFNDEDINNVILILSKYKIVKFREDKISLKKYFLSFYDLS